MTAPEVPQLLRRRWPLDRRWPAYHGYRQFRCAGCYRRFWPWQRRIEGANYFRHPYMLVHLDCARRQIDA